MVLSNEVKEHLDKFGWQSINFATLHPIDIERIENLFKTILDNGLDYEVDDIKKRLEVLTLGMPALAKEHIVDIAQEMKLNHA